MTMAETEGYAPFDGHQTWHRVAGELDPAGTPVGKPPCPA
jgi:hypothetical protein